MHIEIKNKDHLLGIIKNNKLVIVDFWAEWCGPCKAIGEYFKDNLEPWLGTQEGHVLVKINTDLNRELAEEFQINAIPTIIIFGNKQKIVWKEKDKKGKEVLIDRIQGFRENIIEFIQAVSQKIVEA